MPRCIYCREDKPTTQFNREHVVPVSFGRFRDALVLHQTVCRECNDYFGNHLDQRLARDSLEGLERFAWKVKPPQDVGKIRYNQVRMLVDVEGDYRDCLLELAEDPSTPDGIKARPVPQVGFRKKDGGGFKFFTIQEFERGIWRSDPAIAPRQGVKVIRADENAVIASLEAAGITFKAWRNLKGPSDDPVTIEEQVRLTHEHLRAIAKIGFNYMACVHGSDFALLPTFDSTRRYIRRGTEPFLPAVLSTEAEIFRPKGLEAPNQRIVAHIVTITRPLNAEVVLAQVTLFNWIRYNTVLAYEPVADLVESGHVFNTADWRVYPLAKKEPDCQADAS